MCRSLSLVLASTFIATLCAAQNDLRYADAQEMPASLVTDSYTIYQQVLPSNAIEWSGVKRTQWLIEDTTTAVPLSTVCNGELMLSPHRDVTPPETRKAEWGEVLADFDARCHERYKLDGARFHQTVPVHLLDDAARKRYRGGVGGFLPPANNIMQAPPTPDEFKGAAGLHSFSGVYFNHAHTLAALSFGMGCGSLCGNWTWVVLEKQSDGTWQRLRWVTSVTFS